MGCLRFVLAVIVALSHADVLVAGYNPGVVAVICFFLLSGYVMTALVQQSYLEPSRVRLFYLDRLGRIYPQYAFYLAVALAFAWALGADKLGVPRLDAATLAGNVLLVPLNFYMFGDLAQAMLNAPAWSLGLEVLFYLAIPWILIWRKRDIAFGLSLAFYALVFLGLLDSDIWGYRLLPGTLFIFLLGSYLRDGRQSVLLATWAACAVMGACVIGWPLPRPFMAEVLFGVVIGLPVIFVLSRRKIASTVDETLGNISYGLFLSHWPVLMAARALGLEVRTATQLALWVLVSVALAWASFRLVEQPLVQWRRSLRARTRPGPDRHAGTRAAIGE